MRTINGVNRNHPAIDLRADYVPVVAPFDGVVDNKTGFDRGSCGGMIVLNNKELGLSAKFCHMSQIETSLIGKEVKRGTKLGVSGGSIKKEGNSKSKRGNSKDAHLHFELKKDGQFIDPDKTIKKGFCPVK
jgi:murein DD-endopeptidase MepM/ murein hydrolase activator NlpD